MAAILFWIKLYLTNLIDVDIGWLLICLERFLDGGTYTKDFYETNPPLSFLIYLPAFPLYRYLAMDTQTAVVLCFFLYITLSNIILFLMLRDQREIIPLIAALIITQTWVMGISFGSKDHLIFIFLPTLITSQLLITLKKPPKPIITALCIIMGGLAIALKPHYGLLPAIIFAHRLYVSKSIKSCLFSADFLGLLSFGLAYLIFIAIFTPEFFEILPEIINIYSIDQPFPISSRLYYLAFAAIAIICTFFIEERKIKKIIFALATLSLLTTIPYMIQGKGFHYHALPMLGFGMAALFLGVFYTAQKLAAPKDIRLWIATAFVIMLSINFTTGGKKELQTAGQFRAQPLIDTIDERAWNRTYASYDFKSLLTVLPYITDLKHGSRFGQLWPIYGLSLNYDLAKTEEERSSIKSEMMRYVDIIAQDMQRYQPSVITIPQYKDPQTQEPTKNFYNFLMKNENFKKFMKNYDFEATIPFDTSLMMNNTNKDKIVIHDVYVLKQDNDFR